MILGKEKAFKLLLHTGSNLKTFFLFEIFRGKTLRKKGDILEKKIPAKLVLL